MYHVVSIGELQSHRRAWNAEFAERGKKEMRDGSGRVNGIPKLPGQQTMQEAIFVVTLMLRGNSARQQAGHHGFVQRRRRKHSCLREHNTVIMHHRKE